MLRWFINRRLNAEEKKLGVPLEYARHILRASLSAFFKFVKIMPLAEYRRRMLDLPAIYLPALLLVAILVSLYRCQNQHPAEKGVR